MKKVFKKFGFTLAEVMITLVVIGVITAIVMPIVANSTPDKNVMKFKKADTTLKQVIRELVNSDQYYKDGDLGLKPDGTIIDDSHTGDRTYFCNTFADILTAKKVNCSSTPTAGAYIDLRDQYETSNPDLSSAKLSVDRGCMQAAV